MAAPDAAGEIARMERVSDTPRPTTAVETAPNADPTHNWSIKSSVYCWALCDFVFVTALENK